MSTALEPAVAKGGMAVVLALAGVKLLAHLESLGEGDRAAFESKFGSVEEVARLHSPYALPYENGPIYICRGPKGDLREVWPMLKKWN